MEGCRVNNKKNRKKRLWTITAAMSAVSLAAVLVGACWQKGGGAEPVLQPAEAAVTDVPVRSQPVVAEYEKFVPDQSEIPKKTDNDTQRDINEQYQAYLNSLPSQSGQQIAEFHTSLAGHSAEGRVKNIQLANEKLNGHILLPGEELSFNDTLGDSNDPNGGWQLATVIVGKKFEQGYGGGICQVSSTLYNAVKRAGLTVTERHTHSLPVGYVEPGQDATVSYPELDLKFVNTLKVPVRIEAKIANGNVIAKLHRLPEFTYKDE
jgi:vancomycin resistance protein YoaR